MHKSYRRNVAIFVLDDAGRILTGERADVDGAWQLPQGGIEPGETPLQAMYRELQEEIGTQEVELIGQLKKEFTYDWPEHLYSRGHHGQHQTYFVVRIKDKSSVSPHTGADEVEFQRFEWLSPEAFCSRVTGMKAKTYCAALEALKEEFPELF